MIKKSDLIDHLESKLKIIQNYLDKTKLSSDAYTKGCHDEIVELLMYIKKYSLHDEDTDEKSE